MSEWKDTEIGKLPIDAELVELETCIDLIIDHRGKTPIKLGGDWVDSGIKAISAKNVHDGKLTNQDDIRYVTIEMYKKWMKEDLKEGDCLLASEGATLGEHLYWDFDFPVVLGQRLFCIRTNPKKLDPKYFYAFVTSAYFQNQIHGKASGTSVFGLRQTEVRSMLISLIPLVRQKAIGDINYYLNKKIDLLHRQNATLEKMAETLFRQWFVEEAKEEWKEGSLGDFGVIITGKTPSKNNPEFWGDKYDFVTPTDFKNFGMFSTQPQRMLSDLGWNKMKSLQLPEKSILVTCIGSDMGKISISSKQSITNQQLNSVILKDLRKLGFVYEYIKNQYQLLRNIAFGGTTMPIINKSDFSNINISIPPDDYIHEFQVVWESISNKIFQNQNQIRTLTALRDTLLPKLMSGEVTVRE